MPTVQVRALRWLRAQRIHPNQGLQRAIAQQAAMAARRTRTIIVDAETGEILSDSTE